LKPDRWQPVRGGLINLFKYENQEFHYAQGRLLLRGDNGSGKSRVLALQLPFLLDGEVIPSRVEPDRDPAKRLEWNLLMDQHDRRIGYTWIEFGRLVDDQPCYLTLGCGLDARKGGGAPNRWFFVTPARVGHELHLVRSRTPLNRRQLIEAVGSLEEGKVYDKASEYRSAVDAALFRLGGRYRPLIDLLIQLRQPQLTRDMKEERLSDALTEALTPLSDGLIDQVAESFQGLDSDRERTEEYRETLASVDEFRGEYEQYLAAAIRRVCEHVRISHSQFEHATRSLRQLEGQLAANEKQLVENRDRLQALKHDLAACTSEIQTLRSSPEMRSKGELDKAVQRAEECEREVASATDDAATAQAQQQDAEVDRDARDRALEERREEADKQLAALEPVHEEVAPNADASMDWQAEDAGAARKQLDTMIERRRRAVRRLEGLNADVASVRGRQGLARARLDRERGAAEDSAEQVSRSEAALQEEVLAFDRMRVVWERDLVAITPDRFPRDEPWVELLSPWLETRTGDSPFDARLQAAADKLAQEQAFALANVEREQSDIETERDELLGELTALREGQQIAPEPRHTRGPRDADREGTPFWRCFDFRDGVPDAERANWEAALEASGLLDAWILPDGRMDVSGVSDDFLGLANDDELDSVHSLAAILRVEEGASPVLEGLLRRIGNRDGSSRCWMQSDGRWANGPHHGRWAKPAVEFLGHRGREAARERRILELEAQQRALETNIEDLGKRRQMLDEAARQLDTERHAAPTVQRLLDLAVRLDQNRLHEQHARSRLTEAEDGHAEALRALEAAIETRDRDARDLGLTAHAEPDALQVFSQRIDELDRLAIAYWPARDAVTHGERELAAAVERVAARAADVQLRTQRLEAATERARSTRAEADTLQATVGAGVQDVLKRLRVAEHRHEELTGAQDALDSAIRELDIKHATFEAQRVSADEKRNTASEERDRAVARMEVFVAERLFEEVAPETQPDRSSFSATAAVELARGLEKQLKEHPADETYWHQLQGAIVQRFQEFGDQLGRQGLMPQLHSVDQDSVNVVRCSFQGSERSIRELSSILREELSDRERFFEEREREVIENHLIGEAAYALQESIRDGEDWVRKVNDELIHVRTSSGIQLKFEWQVAEPSDEALVAVRRLFLKTTATWSADERARIADFLQSRIHAAREEDETASWSEHLRAALDYRAWHRFGILRKLEGDVNWKRLTKRTFGTGSGGEKAVTLTVPLFAAAAAHYQSADKAAPRLILLDEVFAGIDEPTRARLMGLLEAFDLDYVMTSQLEWGFYATVSALAIYHLSSRPGNPAVAVTRWVWNGRKALRVAEDAKTLAVASEEDDE